MKTVQITRQKAKENTAQGFIMDDMRDTAESGLRIACLGKVGDIFSRS